MDPQGQLMILNMFLVEKYFINFWNILFMKHSILLIFEKWFKVIVLCSLPLWATYSCIYFVSHFDQKLPPRNSFFCLLGGLWELVTTFLKQFVRFFNSGGFGNLCLSRRRILVGVYNVHSLHPIDTLKMCLLFYFFSSFFFVERFWSCWGLLLLLGYSQFTFWTLKHPFTYYSH